MGTGKTTIGKALAESLGREFMDTDEKVEERDGRSIAEIFSESGEIFFRDLEAEVVKDVCEMDAAVISFGGGVLLDPSNARVIRERTFVVLLKSSLDTIVARTSLLKTRPLLKESEAELRERVKALLEERSSLYAAAMDIEISTDTMTVDEAVTEITGRLEA
jgi:shikimate kinase